jgi:hypothetical protein
MGGTKMLNIAKRGLLLLIVLLAIATNVTSASAQNYPAPVCEVVIYEELSELADARIAHDLAKSDFAAYEKIFDMIKGLYDAKTIPDMDYVKSKYDRDSSKLKLEKADLILDRQNALVDQYRLICNGTMSGSGTQDRAIAIRKTYLHYRRADCNALAKGIEIAANNLDYNRQYLQKIAKLRQEKFATNTQVVLAERDVELEEKSLTDANRRTEACRAELADLERSSLP